jgi:hypothetical protein
MTSHDHSRADQVKESEKRYQIDMIEANSLCYTPIADKVRISFNVAPGSRKHAFDSLTLSKCIVHMLNAKIVVLAVLEQSYMRKYIVQT